MEGKCSNQSYLELMHVSKAVQECIQAALMNFHLNTTEFTVLEQLYLKGKQTIQQVGQSILITSVAMTYVIDKLEKRGQLQRIPCPEDRRVVHLILTNDGKNLIEKVIPTHEQSVNDMFETHSQDEATTFVTLLKSVKKQIRTMEINKITKN